MVSVTHVAHDIEVTAEGLQAELARLELQKQALERELAAVVAHLASVQRTLSTFASLMRDPAAGKRGQAAVAAAPQEAAAVSSPGTPDTTTPAATPSAAPKARKARSGKSAGRPAADAVDPDGQKQYGQLTEQIMEYFASVGDVDVRARDVAAALGRDSDSGSINAVRSTLDRLVGTSRVRRAGRGLYRAQAS
ncbi:hypothetical protein ACWD3I_36835 [Streptomyces sp. NPDC002817]|uniref:hypothetical protein n=1 Tax=Streptomyces sp. NPDC088357 TaxID=3154655 RepID=UPI00344A3D19